MLLLNVFREHRVTILLLMIRQVSVDEAGTLFSTSKPTVAHVINTFVYQPGQYSGRGIRLQMVYWSCQIALLGPWQFVYQVHKPDALSLGKKNQAPVQLLCDRSGRNYKLYAETQWTWIHLNWGLLEKTLMRQLGTFVPSCGLNHGNNSIISTLNMLKGKHHLLFRRKKTWGND